MEWKRDDYVVTDDRSRLDRAAVCALLHATYWAHDRPSELIEKSMENSVCFSLLYDGRQVGFARAVTDHATYTWVCDVIVHTDHRARGLGQWLMQCLLEHPDLQTTTHNLRTKDAHTLYEKFGFERIETLRRSTKPY